MPDPCPCGSGIKSGQAEIAYITQDILDTIASYGGANIVAMLDPLYGRAINLTALCTSPPPQPLPAQLDWWDDPVGFLDTILAQVLKISWNEWCECLTCPPISGCTGANSFTVGTGDAYCDPAAVPPPTDPCFPCQRYEYLLNNTTTYYAQRSDGTCYGPFTGLDIQWTCPDFDPPHGRVKVQNANGSGAVLWDRATYGDQVQVFVGSGSGAAPTWIFDDGGHTADAPPAAPSCDDTTICTAVDYIRDRVTVLDRQVSFLMQALNITNASGTLQLPGDPAPITGPLSQILVPAVQTLLPIEPAQLVDPDTTIFPATGTLDVTGRDFLSIVFDTVPDYFGYRGTTAPIYYSNARSPGPGWVLLVGDYGVLEYHPLVYPAGLQLPIPPLATDLLLELTPGVQVSVTTYHRNVS
jgi:hypothetical protein